MTAETFETAPIDRRALDKACMLLFGEGTEASPEFISYMQMPGLKAAFRSLAMRNHPDLAASTGIQVSELQRRFMAVRQAYELLVPYVSGEKPLPPWQPENSRPAAPRHPDFSRRPSRASSAHSGKTTTADTRTKSQSSRTFFRGNLPRRELRFGEFLYYQGIITWEDLFSALVWQRMNRPRLGEIALEKGMLTADDMLTLRRAKRIDELSGETAVRMKLLNDNQLRLLLGFQRLYNCPIGRYFVEQALITTTRLAELLRDQYRHNLLCRSGR